MHMCVYGFKCECPHMGSSVHTYMCRVEIIDQIWVLGVFLNHFPIYVFEIGFLNSLYLPTQIGKPQRSICLHLPVSGITFVSHHIELLAEVLGSSSGPHAWGTLLTEPSSSLLPGLTLVSKRNLLISTYSWADMFHTGLGPCATDTEVMEASYAVQ